MPTSRLPQAFQSFALLCCFLTLLFACGGNERGVENRVSEPEISADSTDERPGFLLNQQGDSALLRGDYPAAMAFFQRSMDSAAVYADSFIYFDSKLDLACVHERLNDLPAAIEMGETVLAAFIRSEDSSRIGRAYTTLTSFYSFSGRPEKALDAAKKGFNILKTYGSLIERCAAYNQMAFMYSDAGNWAEALPLLDSALLLMRASGHLDQIAGMYLNIGDCYRELRRWPEARVHLQNAVHIADSLRQLPIQARAIERLSQIAEASGDLARALDLYKQSVSIKKKVFTDEKTKAVQTLETAYKTKEKEQEITLLRSMQQTEVARRKFAWLLSGGIVVLAFILLFRWRKALQRSRRELVKNNLYLQEFAKILREKNEQLFALESALETQNAETGSIRADQAHSAATISADPDQEDNLYNRRILTDSDWAAFKSYFERSYPGYLFRLRKAFPDLSAAEERLVLLLKLNFTRQETAATLGISMDSVKKGRSRLRKRLELAQDEDLERFIRGV